MKNSLLNQEILFKNEAAIALLYFLFYLCYLCIYLESELFHWLTMVIIPFFIIYSYRSYNITIENLRNCLNGFGIAKNKLSNGIIVSIGIGLSLSLLQLILSRNNGEIIQIFKSSQFIYLFPKAILLLILTAGFTEEFFFRGFIQTRLALWISSKLVVIIMNSILFGIYHLPYAYFHSHWPSHGNLNEAISLSLGQGIPAGLILGGVYSYTKNNLLACVIVHTLLDSFPAMLIFK